MTGYADPELLLSDWLHAALGDTKVWCDPKQPSNAWINGPWVWMLRGQSPNTLALSLDDVLLDCDSYGGRADNVRELGTRVRDLMMLSLPGTVLPGGVAVTKVETFSAPAWAPDPVGYRRTAAYRVILHGFVT